MESVKYLPSQEAIQQLARYISGLKDTTSRKKMSAVGQVTEIVNSVGNVFTQNSYLSAMTGCVYFNVRNVRVKACFPNSRTGELQAKDLAEKLCQAGMAGLEAELIFGGRSDIGRSGKGEIPYALSWHGQLFVKGAGKELFLPVSLELLQLKQVDNPAVWTYSLVQRAYQG